MGWQEDKQKSDLYIHEIKAILGVHLIGPAPEEEDQQRNTDLIVLKMEAVRIACRIRTPEYYVKYPNDFTIRYTRPNGADTEFKKVMSGWGDYLFYGFGDDDERCLQAWRLGDLKVFRWWLNRELYAGRRPYRRLRNRDGSSDFLAFTWTDLPDTFVVADAKSHRQPMRKA